jgi:hypothetical protein
MSVFKILILKILTKNTMFKYNILYPNLVFI